MFATIAPLPTPPQHLVEDMDVKKLAAAYAVLALIADPEAHKSRLEELHTKLADLVAKDKEITAAYEKLKLLSDAIKSAMDAHAKAQTSHEETVAAHDRDHGARMAKLDDKEQALLKLKDDLSDKATKIATSRSEMDKRDAALSQREAQIDEKHQHALVREKSTIEREKAVADAERVYAAKLKKLREITETGA